VGLSYLYEGKIIFYASAVICAINFFINFMCARVINAKVIQVDEDLKLWRLAHPKTANLIIKLSSYLSFKMIRLTYSFLYGFEVFKARFSDPHLFASILKKWTYPHIILCNFGIIGVDIMGFALAGNFMLDSQYKIMLIESGLVGVLMIVFQVYEFCHILDFL
jgi:hypothetical protein